MIIHAAAHTRTPTNMRCANSLEKLSLFLSLPLYLSLSHTVYYHPLHSHSIGLLNDEKQVDDRISVSCKYLLIYLQLAQRDARLAHCQVLECTSNILHTVGWCGWLGTHANTHTTTTLSFSFERVDELDEQETIAPLVCMCVCEHVGDHVLLVVVRRGDKGKRRRRRRGRGRGSIRRYGREEGR